MHVLKNGNATIVSNYTWEVPKGTYNTYWKVEKCELSHVLFIFWKIGSHGITTKWA
jgi:hypothetical protein